MFKKISLELARVLRKNKIITISLLRLSNKPNSHKSRIIFHFRIYKLLKLQKKEELVQNQITNSKTKRNACKKLTI
jgi:hypothetical protein